MNRVLRKRDAPGYLGMNPKEFDRTVRPHITEIPIGKRGVGFDRLELDAMDCWFAILETIKKPAP